jgi:hypothetical protein
MSWARDRPFALLRLALLTPRFGERLLRVEPRDNRTRARETQDPERLKQGHPRKKRHVRIGPRKKRHVRIGPRKKRRHVSRKRREVHRLDWLGAAITQSDTIPVFRLDALHGLTGPVVPSSQ